MPTFKMTDKLEPLDFLFSGFHVFLFIILLFCVNTSDRFLRVHGSKFLGSFLVVKYFYMNRSTGYRITSFFLFLKFSLHFNISVSQMLASLLISFYFISHWHPGLDVLSVLSDIFGPFQPKNSCSSVLRKIFELVL